ncbi:type II toxin-antitoxin system HicA family toxin [Lyngbya sp. CCY1209]|uniref:type II toxin-antitoxin system HicA family toxin n=1 Tax=Lyngbya sp. CCY1209 TaxID=2886103 RepID=UPI002D2056FF|nr:type II toxin-antitoxin system HicA family toxin [Lyngbya sp. CCY1209]MEB3884096.1 type II toxin-antitoxin system HicA family toxin [Lyngbya sp. CCY1209]
MKLKPIKQSLSKMNAKLVRQMLGRLGIIGVISFGAATVPNYGNHKSYWYGTIAAVQTVDFNILSHTLPTKLSYALIRGEADELQRTVDSNYGLFGLAVTDCMTAEADCAGQRIIYRSDSRRSWADGLDADALSEHPYDVLRDPPPLFAERAYAGSYQREAEPTGRVNAGTVIGRVYYVRGKPRPFVESYGRWARGLLRFRNRPQIFSLTVAVFLLGGFASWLLVELVLYRKRQQRERLVGEAQDIRRELDEQIRQNSALLERQERARQELERHREEQRGRALDLEAAIADYQTQLADSQRRQEENSETLERLRDELAAADASNAEAQEQIDGREAAIADYETRLADSRRRREESRERLQRLRDELTRAVESHTEAREQIEARERAIADYEAQLADSQRQQDEGSERLRQLRDELSRAEASRAAAWEQIDEREAAIADLQQSSDGRERQLRETARTLERLRRELTATREREADARTQIETRERAIAQLRHDLEAARRHSEDLEEQLTAKPDVGELEAARKEAEYIKEQSRDFEIYTLEENGKLEADKQRLNGELGEAIAKISYLESRIADYEKEDADGDRPIRPGDLFVPAPLSKGKMPKLSADEAIAGLKRLQFSVDRQKGSHVILEKTLSCNVPRHAGDVPYGTLKKILKNARVTEDELRNNF